MLQPPLQSIIKKVVRKPYMSFTFETNCIMKKIKFLLLVLFTSLSASAQTEPVEIDLLDSMMISNDVDSMQILTNVNVFKDPRLNALRERPNLVMRNKVREDIIAKRKEALGVTNLRDLNTTNRGPKRVTGSIVTRKGYRVVIYNGSNRTEALNMKLKFMRSYPGTQSYLSYISPSYKIRVGDFGSQNEAYKFLRQIQKAGFGSSFVVPDIVTIKDINVN